MAIMRATFNVAHIETAVPVPVLSACSKLLFCGAAVADALEPDSVDGSLGYGDGAGVVGFGVGAHSQPLVLS